MKKENVRKTLKKLANELRTNNREREKKVESKKITFRGPGSSWF